LYFDVTLRVKTKDGLAFRAIIYFAAQHGKSVYPDLDLHRFSLFTTFMKIYDLTINQLRRAAAIKEQVEQLNKELRTILGSPNQQRAVGKQTRSMSAATKKKIAAAQKARWAKVRRAKSRTHAVKSSGNARRNGKAAVTGA
jgi:prophage DNA circulation protein